MKILVLAILAFFHINGTSQTPGVQTTSITRVPTNKIIGQLPSSFYSEKHFRHDIQSKKDIKNSLNEIDKNLNSTGTLIISGLTDSKSAEETFDKVSIFFKIDETFGKDSKINVFLKLHVDKHTDFLDIPKRNNTFYNDFGLRLSDKSFYALTDYLSILEGHILTEEQIRLIEDVTELKLPKYLGLFTSFKIIDFDEKKLHSINGPQTFNDNNELKDLINNNDIIIVKNSNFITADFYELLSSKKIIVTHSMDFFLDAENLEKKKCTFYIQYAEDKAENLKTWNKQDVDFIERVINKTNKVKAFSTFKELEKLKKKSLDNGEKIVIITDNNVYNYSIILPAIVNKDVILACSTFKNGVPTNTTKDLDLQSTVDAVLEIAPDDLSTYDLARQFGQKYIAKVNKINRGRITWAVLSVGTFIEAIWLIHHLFSYEPGIKTKDKSFTV